MTVSQRTTSWPTLAHAFFFIMVPIKHSRGVGAHTHGDDKPANVDLMLPGNLVIKQPKRFQV